MPAFNRVPVGAYGPSYRAGSRKRKQEAAIEAMKKTPEQKEAWERLFARAAAHFNRPLEPGERGYVGPADASSQQRALEKIVDTEARIAVEGDTAMDDVPFGESGE